MISGDVLTKQQLQNQKNVLNLLSNVQQKNQNQQQAQIGQNFAANFNANNFQVSTYFSLDKYNFWNVDIVE